MNYVVVVVLTDTDALVYIRITVGHLVIAFVVLHV